MPAQNFQCDICGDYFPAQSRTWRGSEGGWELCPGCAQIAAANDEEGPDPMRGVEFPFARNH